MSGPGRWVVKKPDCPHHTLSVLDPDTCEYWHPAGRDCRAGWDAEASSLST